VRKARRKLRCPDQVGTEIDCCQPLPLYEHQIEWTNSLLEHLQFDEGSHFLRVFPHKRSLIDAWTEKHEGTREERREKVITLSDCERGSYHHRARWPIPLIVIEEMIKSLDCLFPPCEKATRKFLHQNKMPFLHEVAFEIQRPLLKDFKFYHDRMIDLLLAYTNPSRSWHVAFKDRRNPVQFWMFWFGLMIFLFNVFLIFSLFVESTFSLFRTESC
jgi:hypothetical protein